MGRAHSADAAYAARNLALMDELDAILASGRPGEPAFDAAMARWETRMAALKLEGEALLVQQKRRNRRVFLFGVAGLVLIVALRLVVLAANAG